MRRRRLLATTAALAALPAAGCVAGDGPGDTPSPSTPTAEFAVNAMGCGTGEDRATVSATDGRIAVTGTIGGSDTCDRAALESVTRRDGELHVAVVTRRVDTPGTPVCAQCLTDIEYEATVEGAGDPSTVVVTHDGTVVTRASV